MTDAVQLSLIGLIGTGVTVGASALYAHITNSASRREKAAEREALREEKREDWKRQDEVAARAEEVARQAAEAARLLKETNEKIAEAATVTNDKLACLEVGQKQIHTLVNSNLTAEMQGKLVAVKGQLIYLRRLVDRDASPEDLAEVESLVAQIKELEAALAERLKQTDAANARVEEGKK